MGQFLAGILQEDDFKNINNGYRFNNSYDDEINIFKSDNAQEESVSEKIKEYQLNGEDFVTINQIDQNVYKMQDKITGQNLAVKKEFFTSLSELKSYENKLLVQFQLKHVNIVQYYGYYIKKLSEYEYQLHVVMEYCEGMSLQQWLNSLVEKKGKISKKDLTSMLQGLTQALLYCQFRRVFHGDIKPSNILVFTETGKKNGKLMKVFKLSDLSNISKLERNQRSTIDVNKFNGSLDYYAPELKTHIAQGHKNTRLNMFKCDIFSLGLVVGQVMLKTKEVQKVYSAIMNDNTQKEKLYADMMKNTGNKGMVELVAEFLCVDEEERNTAVLLYFMAKHKSYGKLLQDELMRTYNLQQTERSKFKQIGILGQGGFGEVHEVTYNGDKYAMKIVKYIDSRLLKENMSEVMMNSAMQHSNIVRFYYYDLETVKTTNKRESSVNCKYNLYSYIELMDCNLEQQMKERMKMKKSYSIEELVSFLSQLAEALKYLQEERNIAHQDLKPQNILYKESTNEYKLCDFGISRQSNLTHQQLTIKGSPMYMAPELTAPHHYRVRFNPYKSDIFSIGLTLLQLVTLQEIKRDPCREEKKQQLHFLNQKTRRSIRENYGEEVESLVWQCLKFDSQQRPDYVGFYQLVQRIKVRQKLINNQELCKRLEGLKSRLDLLDQNDFKKRLECLDKICKVYEEIEDYQNQLKYKQMIISIKDNDLYDYPDSLKIKQEVLQNIVIANYGQHSSVFKNMMLDISNSFKQQLIYESAIKILNRLVAGTGREYDSAVPKAMQILGDIYYELHDISNGLKMYLKLLYYVKRYQSKIVQEVDQSDQDLYILRMILNLAKTSTSQHIVAVLIEKALRIYKENKKNDELLLEILNLAGIYYYNNNSNENSRVFLIKGYQTAKALSAVKMINKQTNYVYLLKILRKTGDDLNRIQIADELEEYLKRNDGCTYEQLYLGYKALAMNALEYKQYEKALSYVEIAMMKFNLLTHNVNLQKQGKSDESEIKQLVTNIFSGRYIKLSYLQSHIKMKVGVDSGNRQILNDAYDNMKFVQEQTTLMMSERKQAKYKERFAKSLEEMKNQMINKKKKK